MQTENEEEKYDVEDNAEKIIGRFVEEYFHARTSSRVTCDEAACLVTLPE